MVGDDVNDEDLDDQGDQGASGKNFFISEFCMHFNILFDIWMFSRSSLMLLYFQIKSIYRETLAKFNSCYTLLFIDDDENDNESDDEEEDAKEKKVVKKRFHNLLTTSIQRVPCSSSSTALMEFWQTIWISLHASLSTLRG